MLSWQGWKHCGWSNETIPCETWTVCTWAVKTSWNIQVIPQKSLSFTRFHIFYLYTAWICDRYISLDSKYVISFNSNKSKYIYILTNNTGIGVFRKFYYGWNMEDFTVCKSGCSSWASWGFVICCKIWSIWDLAGFHFLVPKWYANLILAHDLVEIVLIGWKFAQLRSCRISLPGSRAVCKSGLSPWSDWNSSDWLAFCSIWDVAGFHLLVWRMY